MKKLLLVLFFCASMFGWLNANDVQISYMKTAGNDAKQTIIESVGDKQITLVRISAANGVVSKKRLDTVLTSLVDTFCGDPKLRRSIENGYVINVLYIFGNGLVVQTTINSCGI